eukprot:4707804-Amphidinium_carterae.1
MDFMSRRLRDTEHAAQSRETSHELAVQVRWQDEQQKAARLRAELQETNQRLESSSQQIRVYQVANAEAVESTTQAENAVQAGHLSCEAWAMDRQRALAHSFEANEENVENLRAELSQVHYEKTQVLSELATLHTWAHQELNIWSDLREDWQIEEAEMNQQLGSLQAEFTEEAHLCRVAQQEMTTKRRKYTAGPPQSKAAPPPPPGLLHTLQCDAGRVTALTKAPAAEQASDCSSMFSSGSSSDSSTGHPRNRQRKTKTRIRRKEADSITLPPWPEPQQFRACKQKTYMTVLAAAGRDENRTLKWLQQVEKAGADLSSFTHSSRSWRSLETKLAAAVCAISRGDLLRRLTLLQEACTSRGRPMTGRAALFLLFDAFKVEANTSALMDWTALTKIQLTNQKELSSFVQSWEHMLLGMHETQPERVLEARLYELVRAVLDVQPDIVMYDRAETGTKEHSYNALWQAVLRAAARQRREKLAMQLTAGMGATGGGLEFQAKPEELCRYLGINHSWSNDGSSVRLTAGMSSYLGMCLDEYYKESGIPKLAGGNLAPVTSPFVDESQSGSEEWDQPSTISSNQAAAHVMRLFFVARMCRPDLAVCITPMAAWHLVLVCGLVLTMEPSSVSCNTLCTHNITSYTLTCLGGLRTTLGQPLVCGLNYTCLSLLFLFLFFSGKIVGSWPVAWHARKQGATAGSTSEAEILALSTAMRREALPAMAFMEVVLDRKVEVHVHEDNAQVVSAVQKGFSPALVHATRTFKLSLSFLHEILYEREVGELSYVASSEHRGDLFTKFMPPKRFQTCCELIGVGPPRNPSQSRQCHEGGVERET